MIRQLLALSQNGHDVIAEWDTDTVSPERIKEIESDYSRFVAQGFTPVDITDKKDEIVTGKVFNPEADTLLLPRFQGGSNG